MHGFIKRTTFAPFEIKSSMSKQVPSVKYNTGYPSIDDLRNKALADAAPTRDPVERQTFYRQRSQWIRLYALQRAQGQCEGCGMPAPFLTPDRQPYLEVHPSTLGRSHLSQLPPTSALCGRWGEV